MKITRKQLGRIIKEELTRLSESDPWGGPSYDEQWQDEAAGLHGAEPSANILPGSSIESGEGCVDGDQDGICDFADSDLDDDGIVDSAQVPLDIVDGDTGEIYAQWDDPDNWNDEPFSGMEADFEIWLGKNPRYTRHPDTQKLSQENAINAWWVTDAAEQAAWDKRANQTLVGKYNLPSGGWGIPEPDRGTTSEGTSMNEGVMVSLQPITQINRAEESHESRWMRLAGITEEMGRLVEDDGDSNPAEERYVTVSAQTPEGPIEIELWDKISGVETGFAIVVNPYYIDLGEVGHDPDWKRKDGRTVVGVPQDHPNAVPVGDAYFELYQEWNEDGYTTPIDDVMGWTPRDREWWSETSGDGGDYARQASEFDPEEYVRSASGMWILKPQGDDDLGEDLPPHTGMGRRPSGRHGRGQLSESADTWMRIAGISQETGMLTEKEVLNEKSENR